MYVQTIEQLGQPLQQIVPRRSIVGLVSGVNVPLRRLECPAEALAKIRAAMGGFWITGDQVLDSVRFQAGNAAGIAAAVASRLASPDATVISAFGNTFGVTPDSVPSWRPSTGAWNHGRIARQRFLGAHRLLTSGSLLYSCWGRPRAAGGPEPHPDYLVLARPRQYWMGLGRRYWEAERRMDFDTTTYAFLFAALRAYYGPLLTDAPLPAAGRVRNFENIHCYIRFVADMFNANLPDWVETNCHIPTRL